MSIIFSHDTSGPGSSEHHHTTMEEAQIVLKAFVGDSVEGRNLLEVRTGGEEVHCLRGHMLNAQSLCGRMMWSIYYMMTRDLFSYIIIFYLVKVGKECQFYDIPTTFD